AGRSSGWSKIRCPRSSCGRSSRPGRLSSWTPATARSSSRRHRPHRTHLRSSWPDRRPNTAQAVSTRVIPGAVALVSSRACLGWSGRVRPRRYGEPVGKVKQLFVCEGCGRPSAQWSGKCPGCGDWGTMAAESPVAGRTSDSRRTPAVADLAPDPEDRRIGTGVPGVDRVLGGGLVRGSVVLLAGAPGIGKSTFLLQLASRLTDAGHPCLIASGEEARAQIADRAARLRVAGDRLTFAPGRELGEVLSTADAHGPAVLIVDSVHTIRDSSLDTLAGGPAQVRHCVDAPLGLAKRRGITTLLVGHVTKAGDLAGPRTVEHAVDVLLTFEGEARSARRILVGGKNRFGPEGEVAWFEMGPDGLQERSGSPAPSAEDAEPGCAVAIAMTGRRAVVVEVQGVVVSREGPPGAQVAG